MARWAALGDRLRTVAPSEFDQLELRITALVEQLEAEQQARARLQRVALDFGLMNRIR
jgi:hypothetical protein